MVFFFFLFFYLTFFTLGALAAIVLYIAFFFSLPLSILGGCFYFTEDTKDKQMEAQT